MGQSIRRLRPSTHPHCANPSRNAVTRRWASKSFSERFMSTPNAPHTARLLRARRERPRRRRAAEQRYELAALHSITSSAATSSFSGTVRPSIVAVETLMTSSNLLDCTTGKSAGFAPLRMRPV
jgi:hypothetical protein